MKIIKKFAKFENSSENFFTEEEILEIKDFYNDLVDDLNLNPVEHESELDRSMCSLFKVNRILRIGSTSTSKVFSIQISIRTTDGSEFDDSYATLNKQGKQRYDLVSNELNALINSLKLYGYDCEKSDIDLKLDSWKYITGGIKIIIMK